MQIKEMVKNKVNIRFSGKDLYLEKKGVIQDKTCKKCKKLLLKESDFCECGFFLKAEKNSVFWGSVIFSLVFIGLIWLSAAINLKNIENLTVDNIKQQKLSFTSLSPVNIQIIASLKHSPYNEYIQNIYVKQGNKNKLQVLIKPTYWDLLTPGEKKDLLKLVKTNWTAIYKRTYPNSVLKPEVEFANPE